jgi:hypothetical protein
MDPKADVVSISERNRLEGQSMIRLSRRYVLVPILILNVCGLAAQDSKPIVVIEEVHVDRIAPPTSLDAAIRAAQAVVVGTVQSGKAP